MAYADQDLILMHKQRRDLELDTNGRAPQPHPTGVPHPHPTGVPHPHPTGVPQPPTNSNPNPSNQTHRD